MIAPPPKYRHGSRGCCQPIGALTRFTGCMGRLVASGEDESEYDAFFDECLPLALGIAARLIADRAEAEDIAVEVLGRAYAHWGSLRTVSYRRAWVVRVTTNLVIGRARRRHPTNQPLAAVGDLADTVVLRLSLVAAMSALPRRQREAVALRYLADFSEAEAAGAMGVSQGAVKTHLHRGVTALRSALGPTAETEGDLRVT